MDLDDQFQRYFGTSDLAQVPPSAIHAGTERMAVDFGMEQDPGRKFALWAIMYLLDAAPDIDVAFKDAHDRESARRFVDVIEASS